MDCSTPGFPALHHLLKPAQTHVRGVGDAIQPSCPLSSPSPPAFNLSHIRVFSNDLALHIRCPEYWSFSFVPPNEYSGLISFRMDWFDLLAVQGTLKSLLQHHSSILWHCLLYSPTLTAVHDYWKNRRLFNMLSRFVLAFLSRSKLLLISWLSPYCSI